MAPLSNIENTQSHTGSSNDLQTALEIGPRKKPGQTDSLVHYGRHFGRTIYSMCNIKALLANGILRVINEESNEPRQEDSDQVKREKSAYTQLLRLVPRLEERIMNASEDQLQSIADMLTKGSSSARSDDTKSLKSAAIDWITPRGTPIVPPLQRNVKHNRGFHHEATGALLCPATLNWNDPGVKAKLRDGECIVTGDQWPIFIWKDYKYDSENPWAGLLRSRILISAYKHIFTSPSSVEKEAKATRSGNARIHGMTKLRFSLMTCPVWNRTDKVTDSELFYNSLMEFLEDPDESDEVLLLLKFWNSTIFPEYSLGRRTIAGGSALAKLKEKRALRKLHNHGRLVQ